jgi:hypothetical protein
MTLIHRSSNESFNLILSITFALQNYNNMKKAAWITLGFLLFIFGFTTLVLSLVGVKISFLTWLDYPGPLFGFLAKIFMIVSGIVMVYMTSTDWKEEEV